MMLERNFSEQLLQSRLEIQETIFRSISEEIHDNVGQLLSLASLQLNLIRSDERKVALSDIKENVHCALNELRYLARNINGTHLQQLSLYQFMNNQQEKLNRTTSLRCELYCKGQEVLLASDYKVMIFRLVQECIQNSLKHAQASLLKLTLDFEHADGFVIIIADNGKGFNPDMLVGNFLPGLGLKNIQHRIALLKGTHHIESSAENGTIINLTIPYGEKAD